MPVPLVAAGEWPLVSSCEMPQTSPVQGSRMAEARAGLAADGRSRADWKDVLSLPRAESLAQSHALPASAAPAAGFRTLAQAAALRGPALVTEPPPHSHPAAHGQAEAVPIPVPLVAADEWPRGSRRASPPLPAPLARGSPVAEAHAALLARGRSRVNPPRPAASLLAQAWALPASPTPACGVRPLPLEQLAASRPGRRVPAAAPIAAAHAARRAREPDARNPARPEDDPASVPAGPH